MAIRKALVIVSGIVQQLPAGDTLQDATLLPLVVQTNGESSASLVIGAPVYSSAADTVKRAEANASGTSTVIGLWFDTTTAHGATGNVLIGGILTATTTQWDAVAGTTGGLAFGATYYLDPANVGQLTATAPSTVGQFVVSLGVAMSTTELKLNIQPPIGL